MLVLHGREQKEILTVAVALPFVSFFHFGDICAERVTVFETEDVLYQFNAGWLYNRNVSVRRRQAIDRELVGLRIDGTVSFRKVETDRERCGRGCNWRLTFLCDVPDS